MNRLGATDYMDDMESRIETLEAKVKNLADRPTPYKCPICGGSGLVPSELYNQTTINLSSSSTSPARCRTCNGLGSVWC